MTDQEKLEVIAAALARMEERSDPKDGAVVRAALLGTFAERVRQALDGIDWRTAC